MFDIVPLIFEMVKSWDNPCLVTLNKLDSWIQLHGMAPSFMSENIVRNISNYVGKFVKPDQNNFSRLWRDYLRVYTTINIEQPLKRKTTLEMKNG